MITFDDLDKNNFASIGSVGKEVVGEPVPLTIDIIKDANTDLSKYNYEDVVTELLHNDYIRVEKAVVEYPANEAFIRVSYGTISKRSLYFNHKFKIFYTEDK